MDNVILYTDGACSGNPGPGGWACVLMFDGHQRELSGYHPETTNNRMEMLAAIEGLKALKRGCTVKLHTDSSYLADAFNKGWLASWQQRGWRKADKQPVLNQDLWQELLALCNIHTVQFVKVKGHADDALNQRCDELARLAIRQGRQKADLEESE